MASVVVCGTMPSSAWATASGGPTPRVATLHDTVESRVNALLTRAASVRVGEGAAISGVVNVTVNLPNEVVEQLRAIAAANNTTLTDAIRRSIEINKYLTDREKEGSKLQIETPNKKFQQIIRK